MQQRLAEDYCVMMRRFVPDADLDWCLPAFHLTRGFEIDQLIARAATQVAGFIVLGVHPRSFLGRHVHTSFAYQLLAKAACPVIVIPNDRNTQSSRVSY